MVRTTRRVSPFVREQRIVRMVRAMHVQHVVVVTGVKKGADRIRVSGHFNK
jgi:hypothetical protein